MADASRRNFVLGIDIGTTNVKACLVPEGGNAASATQSRETQATLASELGPLGSEQDAHKICTAVQFCLSRLPKEHLVHVTRIAVSGQMHGVVLWKHGGAWKQNAFGRYDVGGEDVSPLYTWQDGRCTPDFLRELPCPQSHLRLSTGFGCATLFWLLKNRPEDVREKYDRAGTIQDMVVAMVCELERPVMSTQIAASWGYFDTVSGTWNKDRLCEADFPVSLLPDVVQAGELAGRLKSAWYGIPVETPVYAALGDMQSSVMSTMLEDRDAVLNISTSAQLSFLMPDGFVPSPTADVSSPIEYFPYFKGRYLAVAASLNGGNVMAAFVRLLQQWTHELGLGVPESKIWERISSITDDPTTESDLLVVPTLYGERHLPDQRASVVNIDPMCLSLDKVARALCNGLVANMHSMMPQEVLIEAGIQRIVGTGKALTKNTVLQRAVEAAYHLPIVYGSRGDAAVGVALAVIKYG
ncbi:sedoheptulokinase-like [Ornithodoros turicata]|uniref:sedoheptulokinase-like n=1 Tax=Ornithodoros turicata TaxID=34597 RepID=UPI003139A5D4